MLDVMYKVDTLLVNLRKRARNVLANYTYQQNCRYT